MRIRETTPGGHFKRGFVFLGFDRIGRGPILDSNRIHRTHRHRRIDPTKTRHRVRRRHGLRFNRGRHLEGQHNRRWGFVLRLLRPSFQLVDHTEVEERKNEHNNATVGVVYQYSPSSSIGN